MYYGFIKFLQTALFTFNFNPGPIDGKPGPMTQRGTRQFQIANGLKATGVIDEATNNALMQKTTQLQQLLLSAGFNPGPIDGKMGTRTITSVTNFQRAKGLKVDGIVGPQTMSTLWVVTHPVNQPGQQPAPVSDYADVCIAEGHGGFDSGAVGQNGTKEKNVTLAIGMRLSTLLTRNKLSVVMTRTGDQAAGGATTVLQDLYNQCDIANRAKARIFVTPHVNSNANRTAHGADTFYISNEGRKLADAIQRNIVDKTGLTDRGIKTAGYYVLKNTDMPAVLGETGFISNPDEEALLNNPVFLDQIAIGYARGICEYLGRPFSL